MKSSSLGTLPKLITRFEHIAPVNHSQSLWMMTFSDLLLLLLTVFVLRLSMYELAPHAERNKSEKQAIIEIEQPKELTVETEAISEEVSLTGISQSKSILTNISDSIAAHLGATDVIRAGTGGFESSQAKLISLNEQTSELLLLSSTFPEESEELSFRAQALLGELGRISKNKPLALHITGYATDWTLAEKRTLQVARQLIGSGMSEKTTVSSLRFDFSSYYRGKRWWNYFAEGQNSGNQIASRCF
jgi:flagellar motor protein MotB